MFNAACYSSEMTACPLAPKNLASVTHLRPVANRPSETDIFRAPRVRCSQPTAQPQIALNKGRSERVN